MCVPASQSAPATVVVPETPIEPYIPEPPKSRFAKRILELTSDSFRAERCDQCGRHMDLKDKNGHKARRYQHCMDWFCPYCSTRLAKSTFDRWESTLVGLSPHAGKFFTYIEASIPHAERSRGLASQAFKNLNDQLNDLTFFDDIGLCPRWDVSPGYEESKANFLLRVLYLGDNLNYTQWESAFPKGTTLRIVQYTLPQLIHIFRYKLLGVSLSKNSEDRAEQSALLGGLRRFRAHGVSITRENPEEDLFADSEYPANISSKILEELEHKLLPPAPHDPDICPECGERYTEQSQWFAKDAPEPRPHEYVWHPRAARRPPPS